MGMRLSTRSLLAGILLTVFALSSMGPAGVYLLTTLFTHVHGHAHTVHHADDGGLVLAHAAPKSEAGLGMGAGDHHTLPSSELEVTQRRVTSPLFVAIAALAVGMIAPANAATISPRDDRQLISASGGPPLFLKHQALLI